VGFYAHPIFLLHNMKNYIITGLVIAIAVILFLKGCEKPKEIIKTVYTRDTIYKSDTIVEYITNEHYNLSVDTFYLTPNDTSSFLSTYVFPVKDSLLEATILAKSKTRPIIDFKYKLKNFTIHDTLLIKDSVYTEKLELKNKMYFGSEVVVKPMFTQLYLGVDFAHKRGHLFSLSGGYDLRDNEPLIKVGYKKIIRFKK
jgi:hypothetical protein